MNHTQLINYIIAKYKYKSYLEIGVAKGNNFRAIKCKNKIGVDPDPSSASTYKLESDDFFAGSGRYFDIIFIDGLHHADQVKRDIINAWDYIPINGCLVIHDTNPEREDMTHVPRDCKQWCGDVYKAVCQIGNPKVTLETDYGVTVIKKEGNLVLLESEWTWEEFDANRKELLNLKSWEEILK